MEAEVGEVATGAGGGELTGRGAASGRLHVGFTLRFGTQSDRESGDMTGSELLFVF